VAVRNDRFFIGSRYGKRSDKPTANTDGTYHHPSFGLCSDILTTTDVREVPDSNLALDANQSKWILRISVQTNVPL
jgi:hypothetical protein